MSNTSNSKPLPVLSVPYALKRLLTICASNGIYTTPGGTTLTAWDLVQATTDPEHHQTLYNALPPDVLAASAELCAFYDHGSDGFLIEIIKLAYSIPDFFNVLNWALSMSITPTDHRMRQSILVVINGTDEKLVLDKNTWDSGSSSGYMLAHPGMATDNADVFTHENEIPAAFNRGSSEATKQFGLGIYAFRRNMGYFGLDGALHFKSDSTDLPNGLSIGVKNPLKHEPGIAVSINSTNLDDFKERWVDGVGHSPKGYSQTTTSEVHGSCFPSSFWTGNDADYTEMIHTVVVEPK